MVDKKDIKEKTKEIYDVLPKLDDQRCGYKTCGAFARAVAEGKALCYGCVSGGQEVAAKVCEIMGARVPEEAIPQFGPGPVFHQPELSGGRGMGGPDGFKYTEELAKVLGGAPGSSRPPCDNDWVPSTWQVGLTGKIVAPDLYIAVAISGSSQHLAGCSGSKHIVAINKDPEANIFNEASFGVVGDWRKVLPAFTEKVKELLAG